MKRKVELEIDEEVDGDTSVCVSVFRGQFREVVLYDDRTVYIYDALCKDVMGKIMMIGYYKFTIPTS